MNLLKKLLDTSDYQFDKTEVTGLVVVVDFMSVIHKTGLKGSLKRVWNCILAQINAKKIVIVIRRNGSYLENSIKEQLSSPSK